MSIWKQYTHSLRNCKRLHRADETVDAATRTSVGADSNVPCDQQPAILFFKPPRIHQCAQCHRTRRGRQQVSHRKYRACKEFLVPERPPAFSTMKCGDARSHLAGNSVTILTVACGFSTAPCCQWRLGKTRQTAQRRRAWHVVSRKARHSDRGFQHRWLSDPPIT